MEEGSHDSFESSNINQKWLDNIYENIKSLEAQEKYAREGCRDVLEYAMIPVELRPGMLADIQYKNLRMMVTEIDLLLTDLTPVIENTQLDTFRSMLNKIRLVVDNKKNLVHEPFSHSRRKFMGSYIREKFDVCLDIICVLKRDIIKSISHLLYIKSDGGILRVQGGDIHR